MHQVQENPKGVSLVICTYNGAGRIKETLSHILRQDVGEEIPWEVIVVDNGSADDTARVAAISWQSRIPFRVVSELKRGITNARACGIMHASFEYISFIDDDNWIAPGWVGEVYKTFSENPSTGMCGGMNTAVFEVPPPSWFGAVQSCYAIGKQGEKTSDITDARGFLWGAGMSLRRSLYLKIRAAGFDYHTRGRVGTRLSAGDDAELSLAFVAAGYRLWYCEKLMLEHYMPAGRLTWTYAKGLFRGLGESEYLLDLYRMFIRKTNFPFLKICCGQVSYAILYFGWRMATVFKNHENNPRYLSYLARKYYIITVLRNACNYRRWMNEIRNYCLDSSQIIKID